MSCFEGKWKDEVKKTKSNIYCMTRKRWEGDGVEENFEMK